MNPAAKTAQINRAAEFRFLWTRRMEQSALCRALQQPVRLSLNTYVQSITQRRSDQHRSTPCGTSVIAVSVNPLVSRGSYSATVLPHHIIWNWYTGRWWVGCYIWYREEGTGRGRIPPRPLLALPNATAHPSTASVPVTVLQYNGPLLCGFITGIKGLTL